MLTYNNQFEIELTKIVEEEIAKLQESLAQGTASDFADYKLKAGKILGLRMALEYCGEVQSIIARR
jgi:hypothetical protein